MADKFKITYEVDDGYVGAARPRYTSIEAGDLNPGMSDQDLKDLFWEEVERHFRETVHAYSKDEAAFVAWARENVPKDED